MHETSNMRLGFRNGKLVLVGYTNSNMASHMDTHRSTLGYLIIFVGGVVFWESKLQRR